MIHVIHWFVNILTLGLVSIATITTTTYHVDEPIPELNNLSLTQVFESNLVDTNGTFYASLGGTSLSVVNGFNRVTADSDVTYLILAQDYNGFDLDHNYYTVAETTLNDLDNGSSTHRLSFNNYSTESFSSKIVTEGDNFISGVYNPLSSPNTFRIYFNGNFPTGSYFDTKSFISIDLTSLGINLTKHQMDYWFSIYQQAVANNGVYIESNAHLNNNIHLVDVSVMVISFGLWTWLYKFLKGVVL